MYQYMFQGGETYPFGYVGSETINNIIYSLWLVVLLVWDIVRERKIVFTIVNSWVVKHVPQQCTYEMTRQNNSTPIIFLVGWPSFC